MSVMNETGNSASLVIGQMLDRRFSVFPMVARNAAIERRTEPKSRANTWSWNPQRDEEKNG